MTISQRNVRDRYPQLLVGQPSKSNRHDRKTTLINKAPQAKQITTVTITDPGDDTDIDFVINGLTVTTNTGTGNDAAAIAVLAAADINNTAAVRGRVVAEASGDDVVLTSALPGVSFTFDDSDGALSAAATQAAATADPVPFGRLMMVTGHHVLSGVPTTHGLSHNEAARTGTLAKSANFTAQVDTLEVPYVASVEYTIGVTYRGIRYSVQSTADTDQDTTITNLAAALNAVLPANSVAVTDDDSGGNDAENLIFTAEIAGEEFAVDFGSSDDGASHPAYSHSTTKGIATSVNIAAAGVSMHTYDEEVTTVEGTSAQYPANAGVEVLESEAICVENAQGVSFGDAVYVELAAGDDAGKLYNTASSTRALLNRARWERSLEDDTAEVAYNFGL